MMTISKGLTLMKAVREKLNSFKALRSQVSVSEEHFYGDSRKITEPQYDFAKLDKRISESETWLFLADAAIKTCNAKTEIELDNTDPEHLLRPLD